MKSLFLLLALTFTGSVFAYESPCPTGKSTCEVRYFYDYASSVLSFVNPFNGVEFPVGKYYAKGIASNYGDAEKNARALLKRTFNNPDCGMWGGPTPVGSDVIRLRNGREQHKAWVVCNPKSGPYRSRNSSRRLGTMVCGSGGKGCTVIR
jgi:hypothetical protein